MPPANDVVAALLDNLFGVDKGNLKKIMFGYSNFPNLSAKTWAEFVKGVFHQRKNFSLRRK